MVVNNDRVASELIGRVRRTSGLSQAELARRAGMHRSVLSAYEHGRRQPSVAAMARIAHAGGLELEIAAPSDELALKRAGRVLQDVLDLADKIGRASCRERV